MWKHWVVGASTPYKPFEEFNSARRVWKSLSEAFPQKVAAVLMPNHLHLLLPDDTTSNMNKLRGLLGAISKRQKTSKLWQPIPAPREIPDLFHLRRQLRYVALNPCRKALCKDPLEWHWSTYREIMGATIDEQDKAANLARILGEPLCGFQVRFHAYVSGDPSVHVSGTPAPKAATLPEFWAQYAIGEILEASAAALRVCPSAISRRGPLRKFFVHFAYRHGWRQPGLLSRICGTTPRAVQFLLTATVPEGMEAADLCLGDKRLRMRGFPP